MPGWTIAPPVRNNTPLDGAKDGVAITTNRENDPPKYEPVVQTRFTLAAGDILLLNSTVEMRVEMTYATLCGTLVRYTFNSQYVNPDDPMDSAGILARPMGWNVWKSPHYRIDHRAVHFQAPASGVYVFQHVCYGTSSAYTGLAADRIDIPYVEQYGTVLHPDSDDVAVALAALTDRVAALEAAA